MTQYKFNVKMTCGGCSNAVKKALERLNDVSKIDISMEAQTVTVETSLPKEKVFEAIKKTGKEVSMA
ncbi:heavy metal-associated domain-containing protein [Paraphysoderma sedebokerense]|nr:heavy metal-associated domain-containing protein [Paraphysoderma sedebokerense]